MNFMLVLMQLSSVLDARRRAVGRQWDVPADGVLMLWLLLRDRYGASELAHLLRKPRQQVQRALCALEGQGLVTRLVSPFHGRTQAWALTSRGEAVGAAIRLDQDGQLRAAAKDSGTNDASLVEALRHLTERLDRQPNVSDRLAEVRGPPRTPDWDL